MWSMTIRSSANRTGSYSGRSAAATTIGVVVVTAASAAAIGNGDGRYPSSEAWCSETTTVAQPRLSAHAAMSIAARYRAPRAVASWPGARMSKRIVNMTLSLPCVGSLVQATFAPSPAATAQLAAYASTTGVSSVGVAPCRITPSAPSSNWWRTAAAHCSGLPVAAGSSHSSGINVAMCSSCSVVAI